MTDATRVRVVDLDGVNDSTALLDSDGVVVLDELSVTVGVMVIELDHDKPGSKESQTQQRASMRFSGTGCW